MSENSPIELTVHVFNSGRFVVDAADDAVPDLPVCRDIQACIPPTTISVCRGIPPYIPPRVPCPRSPKALLSNTLWPIFRHPEPRLAARPNWR